MKKKRKRRQDLSVWFWVACMTAGGVCSVMISDIWCRPFYVEIPGEELSQGHGIPIIANLIEIIEKLPHQEKRRSVPVVVIIDEKGEKPDIDWEAIKKETDRPDQLNSAFYYVDSLSSEEGTDRSVAGAVYRLLSERDSSWAQGIYSLGRLSPREMAGRLGVAAPKVSEWNRVNVSFRNGDGTPISGYSNAKEILSLASVYGYYHQWEDLDSFQSYADTLWKASHSYRVSISDVYYCEGDCQYIEASLNENSPQPSSQSSREARTGAEGSTSGSAEQSSGQSGIIVSSGSSDSSGGNAGSGSASQGSSQVYGGNAGQEHPAAHSSEGQESSEAAGSLQSQGGSQAAGSPESLDTGQEAASDSDRQDAGQEADGGFGGQDAGQDVNGGSEGQDAGQDANGGSEGQGDSQEAALGSGEQKGSEAAASGPGKQDGSQAVDSSEGLGGSQAVDDFGRQGDWQAAAHSPGEQESVLTALDSGSQGGGLTADSFGSQGDGQEAALGSGEQKGSQAPAGGSGEQEVSEAAAGGSGEQRDREAAVSGSGEQADSGIVSDSSQSQENTQTAGNYSSQGVNGRSLGERCRGHVDLNISAQIIGLDEKRNLCALDTAGNQPDPESGQWNGWDATAQLYARTLESQDWYALYGLTSSASMYVRNPLSASEVAFYLNLLPQGTSLKRREVVRQALLSIGSIPYYWGGKPSHKGFEGNGFGTVVFPDEDGRNLRGLDCSGWINWVYWTALGSPLPYESTSGLISCGKGITKDQLQAGDILIRTGESRHVYMFLAWADNGSMYLIHETTGNINNVTIDIYDVDLPYYRSLINED